MDEFDIPIFKQTYNLYLTIHSYRNDIKKRDRFIIWQKCENILLNVLLDIISAAYKSKNDKADVLEKSSIKLNQFRLFIRLAKDVGVIDAKKYILIQKEVDDIGKMLGGWIKSSKEKENTL